ncbi:MAG: hypothetical protein JNM25_19765 [Planctomycetes bacterium]|nr:hypothetical protein [Planctomycetota bacterium]
MRSLLRLLTCALLAWQAIVVTTGSAQRVVAASEGWHLLFTADTETRLRQVLGEDAALFSELRTVVASGTVLLNQQVQGSLEGLRRTAKDEQDFRDTFARLAARNGLFVQLSGLLYPDLLFLSVAEPIAVIEAGVQDADDALLFVFEGDPVPTGRAGWTCTHQAARFQLWRFQKA